MKKDNKLILSKIKSQYNFKSDAEFARYLGIAPNTLSNWYNRNSMDHELVISKCEFINANWLLTGKGNMLKSEENLNNAEKTGLPLIPIDAMAGFGGGNIPVLESEITDYYQVPLFEKRGAEYLIPVAGDSMYPKYASGDLLACKSLIGLNFIQWGRPYVLDTEQGVIVKRLFQHPNDESLLICKSDNTENYPPFQISKQEIFKVAIVVGVVRLE